ncbi:zinc-binding dehydrogenase [Paracoccus sp. R12_1]|uniref:zinc-binding dehydrogenase n=1 Tax=unclassified Paracoccus (in: a-proteobacteria) TaxID=2688777 RepID=UPI000C0928F5|nr:MULTISPECIES: zinc-binding dehydrogenase [unclassified Paracoccus (in: a-proteobacteria)]MBO9455711.1 zinc-binding dehydrogenase [Paracoccus sp. R12_2]MBO9487144.1 zinc-binding dehydrogenase [Paracoccus sp. R12_1]PHQ69616.1 MAG: NADH oxidase [Paracoccus sp. (in: a-proteobacteria)]
MATTGKQLFTTLDADGTLTVAIEEVSFPDPTGDQVLVKMEAAPINPSDLAILAGAADLEKANYAPGKFVATVPEPYNAGSKSRHGLKLPAGNEGAGTVVAAGDSDAAKALMGQRIACVPGNAYSQYCIADAASCLPLGDHSAEAGASAFVNPMTALGFVENARMDGQEAILHTVGASNLGQMLTRICNEDGIGLINIVRKASQAELLAKLGSTHVVNSSSDDFMSQLRSAIEDTGAFYGFDPIGGGRSVDHAFQAMEQVAVSRMAEYSRYGSNQPKRMFIYGRLDTGMTMLSPSYGFGWTLSGWLLFPFLQAAGSETVARMRKRVLDNLTTTFASHYKKRVNLDEMLTKDAVTDYSSMKTGEKYLVTPWS